MFVSLYLLLSFLLSITRSGQWCGIFSWRDEWRRRRHWQCRQTFSASASFQINFTGLVLNRVDRVEHQCKFLELDSVWQPRSASECVLNEFAAASAPLTNFLTMFALGQHYGTPAVWTVANSVACWSRRETEWREMLFDPLFDCVIYLQYLVRFYRAKEKEIVSLFIA